MNRLYHHIAAVGVLLGSLFSASLAQAGPNELALSISNYFCGVFQDLGHLASLDPTPSTFPALAEQPWGSESAPRRRRGDWNWPTIFPDSFRCVNTWPISP